MCCTLIYTLLSIVMNLFHFKDLRIVYPVLLINREFFLQFEERVYDLRALTASEAQCWVKCFLVYSNAYAKPPLSATISVPYSHTLMACLDYIEKYGIQYIAEIVCKTPNY